MRHFVAAAAASVAVVVVVVAYRHSCLSVASLPTSVHLPADLPPSTVCFDARKVRFNCKDAVAGCAAIRR